MWRLQTEDGDATSIRAFDDDRIIVNMSVWESVEALAEYVFRHPEHRAVLTKRRKWFHKVEAAHVVLWRVPAGHVPTVEEAEERLEFLREHGPTPVAFTFKHRFTAPAGERVADDRDDWLCPA